MASTSTTGFLTSQLMAASPLPAARNSNCCSFPVQPPSTAPKRKLLTVVAAVGELSSDSTTYLVAGAAVVALVGTAFPILFSRKDTCPECDGAGFVREAGGVLRANAARKDLPQIVCKRCNGLGKLNQIDK